LTSGDEFWIDPGAAALRLGDAADRRRTRRRAGVDDSDLVRRAQHGDVDAFAVLTSPRTRRLFTAARMIVRDDELAADVVQEALFRAWRDLKAIRDPAAFDAWLRRILVRGCYAATRRRSRGVVEIALEPDWEPDPGAQSGRDWMAAVAQRDQLDRAFARLKPEQRAIVTMHFYFGLSIPETADALGIPVGTTASRLSRALQTMRAAVEADDRTPTLAPEVAR
jgi:RNA polymerase sigma-70 factor, ECF subfamily